ncbi:MAG: hypothetical protein JXR25_10000 [Pontiellaceae bacterium]|nr:hypothetical protein [Pontiellaceae bacterium]MBN2785150.1 hypothetical protein [Pontiellaceae bacterium]
MKNVLSFILLCCALLVLSGCGTASLFHSGPMAELSGIKADEIKDTSSESEVTNKGDVAVDEGTSVQATTSVQGDGFWIAVKDTAPKLAYALAACVITLGSRKSNFWWKFEGGLGSSRSLAVAQ